MNIKINKKIFNNKIIFEDTEIYLEKGIYILQGENGSGKTTLFNILYREDEKFVGNITYEGKNIQEYDLEYYRNFICTYFTQNNSFFDDLTVEEIIKIFYQGSKVEECQKLLVEFKLIESKKKKFKKLSGGQKQKIRLIICLVSEAHIILLDEPENNLDKKSIEFLYNYIKTKNKIIVISSHYIKETSYNLNVNFIKIENKKIEILKRNQNCMNEEPKEKIANIKVNKIQDKIANIKIIKKMNNNLNISALVIAFIILIFSLISSFFLMETSYNINRINDVQKEPYGEVSTVIYPPIYNSLFDQYGTSEWIEKHDSYFTIEDYNKLSNIEYVTKVEPIKPWNQGISHPYTEDEYLLGPDLNYSTLNYEKYKMEEYRLDNKEVPVEYIELLSEKDILENLPLYYYSAQIDNILYGEIPNDGTSEIMINIYMAMYLADEYDLATLEELVGKQVKIPAVKVTDYNLSFNDYPKEDVEYKSYTVSGIFVPPENLSICQVIGAYDKDSLTSLKNNYGFKNDEIGGIPKIEYVYPPAQADNENVGKKFMSMEDFKKKYPDNRYFTGFYITVEEPNDLEELTKTIENNDKYIEINNNYTIANTNNYKYLSKNINKNIIEVMILQVIIIFLSLILYKYYKVRYQKNIMLLKFYGFSQKVIKKVNRLAFLKLIMYNVIIMTIIILILIILGLDILIKYYIFEYILVFLVIYITNLIKWRNK